MTIPDVRSRTPSDIVSHTSYNSNPIFVTITCFRTGLVTFHIQTFLTPIITYAQYQSNAIQGQVEEEGQG